MDYGDYYCGLYKDYCMDPFPRSLLSTRQTSVPFRTSYLAGPWAGFAFRARFEKMLVTFQSAWLDFGYFSRLCRVQGTVPQNAICASRVGIIDFCGLGVRASMNLGQVKDVFFHPSWFSAEPPNLNGGKRRRACCHVTHTSLLGPPDSCGHATIGLLGICLRI